MAIRARWGSVTHTGCVRDLNQDATLTGPTIFAVADGMGGHAAGEVASAIVVGALADAGASGPLTDETLLDAIHGANQLIRTNAEIDPSKEGMGTTAAGVALLEAEADRVLVFNVGDSRVYRSRRGGAVEQVSNDHSVVGELVRAGQLDPADARHHRARNVITRALGLDAVVDVDTWTFDARATERFLICSDGLTNEVDEQEMAAALQAPSDPQVVADELLQLALDRGARDNVSVVVVEITEVTAGASDAEVDTNPRLVAEAIDAVPLAPVVPHPGADGDDVELITGVPFV